VNCNGITEEFFGFIAKIVIKYSEFPFLSFIIPRTSHFGRFSRE